VAISNQWRSVAITHLARAGREQMRILVERSERRDDIHGRLVRRTTDGRIKA
jgi:hypothetical protein